MGLIRGSSSKRILDPAESRTLPVWKHAVGHLGIIARSGYFQPGTSQSDIWPMQSLGWQLGSVDRGVFPSEG